MTRIFFFVSILASTCLFAASQHRCDIQAMENSLVVSYAFEKQQAHAFALAFDSFLTYADLLGVRLEKGVYDGDLLKLKDQLINQYAIEESRAEYFINTVKMVRLITKEYQVTTTDEKCLGMK